MQHRTHFPARRQGLAVLAVLLALVLAACGGRAPTPAAPATPTLIPTLAPLEPVAMATTAPQATVEPVATVEPEETAEPEATVVPSEEMTGTEAMAGTEALTATEEAAAAEEVTATEAITGVQEVTATEEVTSEEVTSEEVTAAEAVTATEEMTAAAEMTETAALTTGDELTETEDVGAADEMTGTEAVAVAEEITATEALTGSEEVSATETGESAAHDHGVSAGAEVTATEEVTASEEMTAAEDITETEEVTESEEVTETEEVDAAAEMTATEETDEEAGETPSAAPLLPTPTRAAAAGSASGTDEGRVYFLQPTTNAIIPITSTVVIGYEGVEVQASGAQAEGAGHLHILVDEDFVEAGQGMPVSEGHLHLADGSAETELVLTPGSHVLRLQFADGAHIALEGDQYRDEIYVNVIDGAPEETVRFVTPTDGAIVPPTFNVVMAASGLSVEPSGPVREDAGHLHILVDEDFVEAGEVIPADETHLHFGAAQLTGTVTLEPGEHTLRLQFADGEHRALEGDQYRAEITVTVDEAAEEPRVQFTAPEDGATVTAPVTVAWAASGLILESVGEVVRPEAGHVFVLLNNDFVPAGEVLRSNATRLRFGRGQTSAEIDLRPGEYTLRLQVVDGAGVVMEGEQYQDELTITVE